LHGAGDHPSPAIRGPFEAGGRLPGDLLDDTATGETREPHPARVCASVVQLP